MKITQEKDCGINHATIKEAIRHAEENLGFRGAHVEPYWGTTRWNCHLVVGYQSGAKKRWRLDFSGQQEDGQPPKFIHVNEVNEENFEAPPGQRKVQHRGDAMKNENGHYWVELRWRKWTSGYDPPEKVREEIKFNRKSKHYYENGGTFLAANAATRTGIYAPSARIREETWLFLKNEYSR